MVVRFVNSATRVPDLADSLGSAFAAVVAAALEDRGFSVTVSDSPDGSDPAVWLVIGEYQRRGGTFLALASAGQGDPDRFGLNFQIVDPNPFELQERLADRVAEALLEQLSTGGSRPES